VTPELRKKLDQAFTALFYAALLAGLAVMTSHPVLRDETIVSTIGVANAVKTDDGDAAFRISHQVPRYHIMGPDSAVMDALRASSESGNSVTLRVHLDGARFRENSDVPNYWIESVEYLGRTYGPYDARIRWSWRKMTAAPAALLRAVAFEQANRSDDALKSAEIALAGGSLSEGKLALAQRTRGHALQSVAYPPGSQINDRDDALLMRALQDIREAARLDPSESRDVFGQGYISVSLGAYPEALALYAEAGRRWPEMYYRAAISRGAAYREMGDYTSALNELDTLVKAHGPQDGMMYHYHRGWTLTKLARYAEAEKEFTDGLKTQPDYLWASVGRACARAEQGHVSDAIQDQTRALELWDRDAKVDASMRKNAAQRLQLAQALQELDAALSAGPEMPSSAACANLFSTPTTARKERCRLFVPAAH
jgi:tetratricopeptide (TPR) repeat protein